MKNKFTVFGSKGIFFLCAIALAVAGLALTGCPTDGEDTGNGGGGVKGKLTITDLPSEAKDLYIIVTAGNTSNIVGLAEKPASTDSSAQFKAVKITGTSVVVPLWKVEVGSSSASWVGYDKTESRPVSVHIGNTEKTSQSGVSDWSTMSMASKNEIAFTNGNATAKAADFE